MKGSPHQEDRPKKDSYPDGLEQGLDQAGSSPDKKKRFQINIFRGWCKSCGICAAFCPQNCIGFDDEGNPIIDESTRCSGCGWCELHCPDFAISIRPQEPRKSVEEE